MFRKLYTLVFLKQTSKLLLGYKTRGLGVNYWNGFGGKLEKGESIVDCAKRELKEESNLEAELKHLGVVCYEFKKNHYEVVYVFTSTNFWGDIEVSEEMNPIEWHPITSIPFTKMWPDAEKWFPTMLNDQHFTAIFNKDENGTIKYDIITYENYNEFSKAIDNNQLFVYKNLF